MSEQVYGASTIKRPRRTDKQVEQLDRQIILALRGDYPQSVRHVFYLMTNPRLDEPVEKSDRGYRHVQHRIVELRKAGIMPYGWITDASRHGYFTATYNNAAEYIKTMASGYRSNLWKDSPFRCEKWVESRSIPGILLKDSRYYAATNYPAVRLSRLSVSY